MERFDCGAGELDQRAIMFVLDLERVSFPVVWEWTTYFNFTKDFGSVVWLFSVGAV